MGFNYNDIPASAYAQDSADESNKRASNLEKRLTQLESEIKRLELKIEYLTKRKEDDY